MNSPVFGERGEVAYIIHRVEDVTDFVHLKQHGREQHQRAEELEQRAERMEAEIYRRAQEIQDRERALSDAHRALRLSHEQLKATQLQLVQSARLETIGRLAAGIAHEVKNPLAIMLAGLQYLEKKLPQDEATLRDIFKDLQAAVWRANSVIGELLSFAASTELRLEEADVDEVVTAAIQLVRHALQRQRVQLKREQGGELPRLRLDRAKIEQVLVNLMINSIDAMPENGTLTVRTSLRQLAKAGPDVGYRQTDMFRVGQTVVVIEIEDSGTGIPADKLEKIFDPFFTTKAPGKGTGLGLAVSRTIVDLHRGSVRLENRAEGGARAILMLKPAASSAGREEPKPEAAA